MLLIKIQHTHVWNCSKNKGKIFLKSHFNASFSLTTVLPAVTLWDAPGSSGPHLTDVSSAAG